MFIASVDTRNFSFMAAGNTEEEALNVLRCGWNQHAAATGATMLANEIVGDAHVEEINPGMCIVDGDLVLYSEPHPAAECDECGGMGHTIGFEGPKRIKYPCESCSGGER